MSVLNVIQDVAALVVRLAGYALVFAFLPIALLGAALSAALAWLTPMTYDQAGAIWALIFCVLFWVRLYRRFF